MISSTTVATLLAISIRRDFSLELIFNPIAIVVILFVLFGIVCIRWWIGRRPNFEIDTAELGIGSQKISFKPNLRDQEIAYKIWVELSTRKIGLPIDLKHDVISEVYDSWYNFFSLTRELIKDIPVSKVRQPSTRQIITLSISVLNEGLRPHLTNWQARFRRWYDRQLDSASEDVDPQSIQAKYPRFDELKKDLEVVNKRLIRYREKMRELVLGLSEDSVKEPVSDTPTL